MSYPFQTLVMAAAVAAAAFGSTAAQAAGPRDSTFAGDKYGYSLRADMRDVYSEGARSGRFDVYSEGAKGRFDVFTDGARDVTPPSRDLDNSRALSGMDRRGVSAEPSRMIDVYTDGAVA